MITLNDFITQLQEVREKHPDMGKKKLKFIGDKELLFDKIKIKINNSEIYKNSIVIYFE